MNSLQNYIAEHLAQPRETEGGHERVRHMQLPQLRYLLFKIGRLRFAVPSSDVAAVTHIRETDCEYLDAAFAVPARYRRVAAIDDTHLSYLHFAGTRFGIGPCKSEGTIVVPAGAVNRCAPAASESWIVGTLTDPPSLIFDRALLCAHLHAVVSD